MLVYALIKLLLPFKWHITNYDSVVLFLDNTSGVAPFPGAETGTGGRLRDVQATGRGAHTLAGICGYCVGNLHIPGHPMPWEGDANGEAVGTQRLEKYSATLATPLDIIVEASNGASDYGMLHVYMVYFS